MLVDFESFKKAKELNTEFEKDYNKFLDHVTKFIGVPKTVPKILETLYYFFRYLEGTINSIIILDQLGMIERKYVETLKELSIDWLEDLIERIKEI